MGPVTACLKVFSHHALKCILMNIVIVFDGLPTAFYRTCTTWGDTFSNTGRYRFFALVWMLSICASLSAVKGSTMIISMRSISPSEYMLILRESINTPTHRWPHDKVDASINALLRRGVHTWLGPRDLFRACCTFLRCSSGLLLSGSVSCRQFPPWELAETWGLHLQEGGTRLCHPHPKVFINDWQWQSFTSILWSHQLVQKWFWGKQVNRSAKQFRFANPNRNRTCLNLPFRSFS